MASMSLVLDDGGELKIVVPARAARLIDVDELGLPLDVDEAFDRIHAFEREACFSTLVDMLSRRDHSTEEARRKLLEYGYRQEEIDSVLERARDARYLDDARFSRHFVEERRARGWGRRKIELELARRGIDPNESGLFDREAFDDDEEAARALAVLKRKPVPDEHARERMVRRLVSKGYSYRAASKAAQDRMDLEDHCER